MLLLNVTSHPQDLNLWANLNPPIFFVNDGAPLLAPLAENAPLHASVMASWRQCLDALDESMQSGCRVDGLMLAGYLPYVIGLGKQARDFRMPVFVSVMVPGGEPPAGQKRVFVPGGARQVLPAPFGNGTSKRRLSSPLPLIKEMCR